MSGNNARGGTPTARILETLTRAVVLPGRSEVGGEPISVRIRVISRRERNAIYGELPTFRMNVDEMLEYLKALDGSARAEYQERADIADEKLLVAAIVSPKVVLEDQAQPEGALPIAAVWPDRVFLITEILRFSGFLGTPPAPEEAAPSPPPPATEEELPGDAFRAPAVGAPPGHGGVVADPSVAPPGQTAG